MHKKPISQEPSRNLITYTSKIQIIRDKPIADIACGYGRNGAYFVSKGYQVIFTDCSRESLEFIKTGENVLPEDSGTFEKSLAITLQSDLTSEWPFQSESLGGIINVHFYRPYLIEKFCRSLCVGGFLYLETVDARGENYRQLPIRESILSQLGPGFNVLLYREKAVPPESYRRSTVKLFAVKK